MSAYNWKGLEQAPEGGTPIVTEIVRSASPAHEVQFSVPTGGDIAVDLIGYILPPGEKPPHPKQSAEATSTNEAEASAERAPSILHTQGVPSRIGTEGVVTGEMGDVFLTAPTPFTTTGVLLSGKPSWPFIVARPGTSDLTSAFAVVGSDNRELLRARADGPIVMFTLSDRPNSGLIAGARTDYAPSVGSSAPTNVIHDVEMRNPRDTAGGSTQRIVFYRATTTDEYTSPPVTRFEASTANLGNYLVPHINFDSQIGYHNSLLYHFRARSTVENKDTFWLKAGTDSSAGVGTRADMYVSGRVGVGTENPQNKLHVGLSGTGGISLGAYNAPATAGVIRFIGVTGADGTWNGGNITGGDNGSSGLAIINTAAGTAGNSQDVAIYSHHSGAQSSQKVIIKSDGNVGIGTATPTARLDVNGAIKVAGDIVGPGVNGAASITGFKVLGAVYQDLAEWVPATTDLAPGTVVVLNPARNNEVMASTSAYDTSVAGVVSEQPGLILGIGADDKEQIAIIGRVKVRVDARNAPIRVGDLLVTSDLPGTAMRSEPMEIHGRKFHQPGTIIGKALEPLESGVGEILVLLSMQ